MSESSLLKYYGDDGKDLVNSQSLMCEKRKVMCDVNTPRKRLWFLFRVVM